MQWYCTLEAANRSTATRISNSNNNINARKMRECWMNWMRDWIGLWPAESIRACGCRVEWGRTMPNWICAPISNGLAELIHQVIDCRRIAALINTGCSWPHNSIEPIHVRWRCSTWSVSPPPPLSCSVFLVLYRFCCDRYRFFAVDQHVCFDGPNKQVCNPQLIMHTNFENVPHFVELKKFPTLDRSSQMNHILELPWRDPVQSRLYTGAFSRLSNFMRLYGGLITDLFQTTPR